FFSEPLAHLFGQGIELSHRSTSGLGRNGDRGSGRSEDPHREATRGVGPVTGSAGSERLPSPGRGPSPNRLAGGGAGPESPTVSVGESGDPETRPVRRRRIGTQVATGS